jgi:hypothetical protein
MADSIRVTYDLTKLHCVEEGDGSGNAEPFMWTVYFKVDGDTVKVNDDLKLEGTATVVTKPGNHGDLPDDVDAGDDVAVPASLGHFATTLRPIKTPLPGLTVGGMVGCIAVVMEEDSTPDDAIANGHKALNKALQNELDGLIPTLGIDNEAPTEADIDAVEKALKKAVTDAVAEGVDFWDVLGGLFGNNQDDMIGTARFIFSHDDLDKQAGKSFAISQHWPEDETEDGSFTLHGKVTVAKQLVAGCARGGDWGNRLLFGRTTAQFVDETQKLFDEKGLRLVHLETWKDFDGVQRWASIHRTGSWGNRLKVGLSTAQLVAQHAEYEGKGFGLERVAWWNQDGQVRWAGCWRDGLPDTSFEHGLDTQAFVNKVQFLFDERSMRLMQAIRYTDSGGQKWAGVFQVGNQAHRFYIRDDVASLNATAQQFFDEKGLRTIDFETWVEGGKRRYAGISISGNWASRRWTHTGTETFLTEAQKAFDDKGLRLTSIDVYTI